IPGWVKEAGKTFEVLTFDCYGTLIDWESGIVSVIRPLLEKHGLFVGREELLTVYAKTEPRAQAIEKYKPYKEILSQVMAEIATHFGMTFSAEEKDSLAFSVKDWFPFTDTVDALHLLKKKFKLAIISNIDRDLFDETQKHLKTDF